MEKVFPVCSQIGLKFNIINTLTHERLVHLATILQECANIDILKNLARVLSMFVVDGYLNNDSKMVRILFCKN